jgi:Rad3-related DNA helicase
MTDEPERLTPQQEEAAWRQAVLEEKMRLSKFNARDLSAMETLVQQEKNARAHRANDAEMKRLGEDEAAYQKALRSMPRDIKR